VLDPVGASGPNGRKEVRSAGGREKSAVRLCAEGFVPAPATALGQGYETKQLDSWQPSRAVEGSSLCVASRWRRGR
jgi:hypothetical protein